MTVQTEQLTIPEPVDTDVVSAEQVTDMYKAYCTSTHLEPVYPLAYRITARYVILPIVQFVEQWRKINPDGSIVGLKIAYEYTLVDLFERLISSFDENIELIKPLVRCLSPLPEDIYPDFFFGYDYQDYLEATGSSESRSTRKVLTLHEFSDIVRSVSVVSHIFGLLLDRIYPDMDTNVREELINDFELDLYAEFH